MALYKRIECKEGVVLGVWKIEETLETLLSFYPNDKEILKLSESNVNNQRQNMHIKTDGVKFGLSGTVKHGYAYGEMLSIIFFVKIYRVQQIHKRGQRYIVAVAERKEYVVKLFGKIIIQVGSSEVKAVIIF